MCIEEKKKIKKYNKSGFTLVELIVVLVILAILASILIPSLLGFIDKSKQSNFRLDARNALIATKAVVAEEYGTNGKIAVGSKGFANLAYDSASRAKYILKIMKLADLDATVYELTNVDVDARGNVICLQFRTKAQKNGAPRHQIQYLNYTTTSGVVYDNEWRMVRWDGENVENWIDPSTYPPKK